MRRSIALGILLAASLSWSARAEAECDAQQKAKAKSLYDKGNVHYNLGRWKEAIDHFTQAFETCDNPDLLFNIAQAYRQDGNCSRAVFFYKRFLALKPNTPYRAEAEKFITQLQPGCVEQPDPKETPTEQPKEITQPDVTPDTTLEKQPEVVPPEEEIEEEEEASHPRIVSLRAAGGASYLSAGSDLSKLLLGVSGGAAYPLHVDKLGIEPGVLISYSPVPWDNGTSGTSGTIGLIGLCANAGITYPLGPRVGLRGDVGAGILVLSGVTKAGNPFLEMGDTADGALSKFHLRLAAGVEFMVAPGFILSAQPGVSYSPPGSDLNSEISSITRFEMLVGAGYRM